MKSGAMALFGEKYGDEVRVVSVGDWARELCGGTHAGRSGQLGVIKLLGESSIGSGVRRVEALVGGDAYRFLAREHVLVAQLSEALKVRPEELPERVDDIVERLRAAEKEIEKVRVQPAARRRRRARRGGRATSAGVDVVAHRADGAGGGDVRTARARRPRPAARRASPAWSWSSAPPTARSRWWPRSTTTARARGLSAPTRWSGAVGPLRRRQRRRQGRRRPGRRHRRLPHRRGARAASRPRSAARRGSEGVPCDPAYGSGSTPATPGSASRAATRPGSSRPRSRPCAAARATWPGSRALVARGGGGRGRRRAAAVAVRAARARRRPRSASSPAALARAGRARCRCGCVDERLTTVSAEAMLRDRGRKGQQAARRGRPGRRGRDPAARTGHRARARGAAPGEIVEATIDDATSTTRARRRRRDAE